MFGKGAANVARSHLQAWVDNANKNPTTVFRPANAVSKVEVADAGGGVWGIKLTVNYAGYADKAVDEAKGIIANWGFRGMPVFAVINDRGTRGAQMQSGT